MDIQDLIDLLSRTDDKLSIFTNENILNEYEFNSGNLVGLIANFLTDEEKLRLFDYSYFINLNNTTKRNIVELVSDESIILKMINDDNIMGNSDFYELFYIIEKLSDSGKKQLLCNKDFIEKHEMSYFEFYRFFCTLSDKSKVDILIDSDLTKNKLGFTENNIAQLLKEIAGQEGKEKIFKLYQFSRFQEIDIIKTFDSEKKLEILLTEDKFNKYDKLNLLKSFDIKTISEFLIQHKDFCDKNDIKPYEVIFELSSEKQKEFIENIDNIDLPLNEKRKIIVILKNDVKESIDASNLPEEYRTALNIQTTGGKQIILDLDKNLEDYRGLDDLICVCGENFTEEQRAKFIKLCDICPDMKIYSILLERVQYISTADEYKIAEEWIDSLIKSLKPEYSKVQKMAIIDNAIGKKISYSPDFDTEVFNTGDCRALWKIVSSGYGVCNGVAKVEKYIFDRVGIKSELISNKIHSFLKIKDIELPLANGEILKGDTILDPTWNLPMHRFGSGPQNFCINYEEARKRDIDTKGIDHFSHKSEELEGMPLISLDVESLRAIFKSVGLTDKDGRFPVADLLEKSVSLHELYKEDPAKNLDEQFLLLSKVCPEFATCQNSSMFILSNLLLKNKNLKFNKCVVNRVYNRSDELKRPILYVYIDSNEFGKKFYFADKDEGRMLETSPEEFINQFECYEKDLEKDNRS